MVVETAPDDDNNNAVARRERRVSFQGDDTQEGRGEGLYG